MATRCILSVHIIGGVSLEKMERLVIQVPKEVKEKLSERAKAKSLSVSAYVRLLLTEEIRKGN